MKKDKFRQFVDIVHRLRAPGGCPWDRKQTHATLRPFMVEELYEAIDAINKNDFHKLKEELGDMLLHIIMHAEFAQETKKFDIDDVIDTISAKMVRRHPHVFAKKKVKGVEEILQRWEEIKKGEMVKAGAKEKSVLENIPKALPALYRADKVQRRAARIGFDWDSVAGAWDKVYEEVEEVENEFKKLKVTRSKAKVKKRIFEEIGDLMFSIVNVTRKLEIDPEDALQGSVQKFIDRFHKLEKTAHRRRTELKHMSIEEMDRLWDEVKRKEKM